MSFFHLLRVSYNMSSSLLFSSFGMLLVFITVCAAILGIVSITLALAAALYYLSELVEENLLYTAKIIKKIAISISIITIILPLTDNLPYLPVFISSIANISYIHSLNPTILPNLSLSSPIIITNAILALISHYSWFHSFSNPYIPTITERLSDNFIPPYYPSFYEISAFFALQIWLIPFSIFILVSSNEHSLPYTTSNSTTTHPTNKLQNLLTYPYNYLSSLI